MAKTKNPWEQKNKIALNLGCGLECKKGFINVDKFYTYEELTSNKGFFKQAIIDKDAKYIQADILHLPFKDDYADYVEMYNTIEHFPMKHVIDYIKEIYRVMKKGAMLRIMTNNMDGLAVDWLEMAVHTFDIHKFYDVAETIYGNQAADGEVHRCPFTPIFLNYIITQGGFSNGKIFELRRNTEVVSFGSAKAAKDKVYRNDLLFVEAVK